ncbi:hypothetical protein [Candidatus Protochlamydia phocaeensis]|uniref:hypothetical protein n=1 Tax=Candidatus Protochlamydia phocaeensis TaxID=1414722 RepID=UPI0008398B99|nr:hypothetical protein [Candidatus Protochlamydia phocaeensis]
MESLINRILLYQWQRKLVALITATVIWIFVSHSITATKTVPFVPVRVINLPPDKTIPGMLPNGFLAKRTALTLSGTKDVIEQLEPGDLEILLDVSNLPNEGIVQITKKNLVSLNPNVNLLKHITSVSHPEFVIKMSAMLTEKIPVLIHHPIGEAPKGYEFLDSWPITLTQTVSGPQEQVLNLKNQGLELTFNLNEITKDQLDALQPNGPYDDEISFYVPDQWKKIVIPFSTRGPEPLNDPEAKYLHLSFLRQQLIPIKNELPIHIFYPIKYSSTINPDTYALASNNFVQMKNQIPVLKVPLFVSNVSKLFLEIVKDNIELEIVTAPKTEREKLEWGVGFIDDSHLEDTYVAFLLSNMKASTGQTQAKTQEREKHFRQRFRNYIQRFTLYLAPHQKLEVDSSLDDKQIRVHIPNAYIHPKPPFHNAS